MPITGILKRFDEKVVRSKEFPFLRREQVLFLNECLLVPVSLKAAFNFILGALLKTPPLLGIYFEAKRTLLKLNGGFHIL